MSVADFSISLDQLPDPDLETRLALERKLHVAHALLALESPHTALLTEDARQNLLNATELSPERSGTEQSYGAAITRHVLAASELGSANLVDVLKEEDHARLTETQRCVSELGLKIRWRKVRKATRTVSDSGVYRATAEPELVCAVAARNHFVFRAEQIALNSAVRLPRLRSVR